MAANLLRILQAGPTSRKNLSNVRYKQQRQANLLNRITALTDVEYQLVLLVVSKTILTFHHVLASHFCLQGIINFVVLANLQLGHWANSGL